MDALKQACEKLGLDPAKVIAHRQTEDAVIFVIDNGIAGAPKYEVKLSDLQAPPDPAEAEAVKVDALRDKYLPKRGRK